MTQHTPTQKCIAYRCLSEVMRLRNKGMVTAEEMPDDNLFIHYPHIDIEEKILTEENMVEMALQLNIPDDATDIIITDRAAISTDRTFRSAWSHDGTNVNVDIPKAKEIFKDTIREARAPLLEALDVEYMKALEINDETEKARIVEEKQVLRDATASPELVAATTPEEILAAWPKAIPAPE